MWLGNVDKGGDVVLVPSLNKPLFKRDQCNVTSLNASHYACNSSYAHQHDIVISKKYIVDKKQHLSRRLSGKFMAGGGSSS